MEKESKNAVTQIPSYYPKFVDELTKFRRLWWDQGNLHLKANWESASLPYELISDVSFEKFAERTDKHNVHGLWEWDQGKVVVYEPPLAPHESASHTTKAGGSSREPDRCLRPIKKQQVVSPDGCDGQNMPWPTLVVKIAYSETVDHLFNKIKNYWLQSNRVHDAIAIKLEPPKASKKKIPSRMTSWHFCVDRKVGGELVPEVLEFGTVDQFGNSQNIQPGQCIIKIKLECIYDGIAPEFNIPTFLPNPITIDLFRVQKDIL
ncbi:11409_t:CDS:2, partial [Dentiscutata erythropus]